MRRPWDLAIISPETTKIQTVKVRQLLSNSAKTWLDIAALWKTQKKIDKEILATARSKFISEEHLNCRRQPTAPASHSKRPEESRIQHGATWNARMKNNIEWKLPEGQQENDSLIHHENGRTSTNIKKTAQLQHIEHYKQNGTVTSTWMNLQTHGTQAKIHTGLKIFQKYCYHKNQGLKTL